MNESSVTNKVAVCGDVVVQEVNKYVVIAKAWLFEKGIDKILKKVGEECTEVIIGGSRTGNGASDAKHQTLGTKRHAEKIGQWPKGGGRRGPARAFRIGLQNGGGKSVADARAFFVYGVIRRVRRSRACEKAP